MGGLFSLSPPLSMLAFSTALLGQFGGATVSLAVGASTVAITATMALVGAGAGTTLGLLSERPRLRGSAGVPRGRARDRVAPLN